MCFACAHLLALVPQRLHRLQVVESVVVHGLLRGALHGIEVRLRLLLEPEARPLEGVGLPLEGAGHEDLVDELERGLDAVAAARLRRRRREPKVDGDVVLAAGDLDHDQPVDAEELDLLAAPGLEGAALLDRARAERRGPELGLARAAARAR